MARCPSAITILGRPGRFDKKGGATSAIKALKIDKLELIRLD